MNRVLQAFQDVMAFLNWTKVAVVYEEDYGMFAKIWCSVVSVRCVNFSLVSNFRYYELKRSGSEFILSLSIIRRPKNIIL